VPELCVIIPNRIGFNPDFTVEVFRFFTLSMIPLTISIALGIFLSHAFSCNAVQNMRGLTFRGYESKSLDLRFELLTDKLRVFAESL
jgi:hypothetical protein